VGELRTVPTLDEVAHHPELAAELAPGMLKALLVKHATVGTILLGALLVAGENGKPPEPDVLLDVETAAKRLATTEDWLYRHARQLPFAVRQGRSLRFSSAGIERYIRSRQGR
jgi:predicted DNA-binding transcriptional regulator AlpA